MRFERLDLNLLVALNSLIELRSVTAAANKLCLSQSALSGSLSRLREFFEDDLLVQVGRDMVLTPRAESLAEPVRNALGLIRATITTPATFDPLTADRTFSLVASDYLGVILINNLLRDVAESAPHLTFNILPPARRTAEQFDAGEIDLLMGVRFNMFRDHPSQHLFSDQSVAICWAENDSLQDELSMEQFQSLGHVYTYFGEDRPESFYEIELMKLGISRRNEVRVAAFSLMPPAVVGTQRIAVMHRRHAEYFAALLPLKILTLPFVLPVIEICMQWHTVRDQDLGLRWLRERLVQLAAAVPPLGPLDNRT